LWKGNAGAHICIAGRSLSMQEPHVCWEAIQNRFVIRLRGSLVFPREMPHLSVYEMAMGLVLVGLVGVEDSIRPEAPQALELLQDAGVTVRMITIDSVASARYGRSTSYMSL
jgi:cation transport ATPase